MAISLAFRPGWVQFLIVVVFAALLVPLTIVNRSVPSAPSSPTPANGVNLTQAWLDLQHLTFKPHPYNSHSNDHVRNWLLSRIEEILTNNKVDFDVSTGATASKDASPRAVVFNDMASNITFSSSSAKQTVYYEGTNIIVYIRGSEDPSGNFWLGMKDETIKGGVLVNAHYDSVSTGYGATDDGVGVITILQLLSHFTAKGEQPKKGIVLLLNNGEEDYLNGAWAFLRHPISQFPHTFLNLEGAGAGGRATLFRSTDTEVTRHYKNSKYPFGTSISADGFKRRLIRSQTDYVVFNEQLGLRGLDVAFMEPRSRYHTSHDSTKYTSIDSLWHMLSASLATVRSLSSDMSSTFDGKALTNGRVDVGQGSDAVYFDLFGRAFVVFQQHTMFAWAVTELVVAPLVLILLEVLLIRSGKWYLFARYYKPGATDYYDAGVDHTDANDKIHLYGWRGFFRYPIIFSVATAIDVALAFLFTKINPLIVYSSEWAVWSTMLTAWIFVTWFLSRGGDAIRPTALSRTYALLWMFAGAWVVLVFATIGQNNFHVSGGYFMLFYFGAIFLALLISYIELFFTFSKEKAAAQYLTSPTSSVESRPNTSGSRTTAPAAKQRPASSDASHTLADDDDDTNERTSLLRGDQGTSFRRTYGARRESVDDEDETEAGHERAKPSGRRSYGSEQFWSAWLPTWTWTFQFLFLSVIPIILVAQIAFILTAALNQTLADGSSALTVYLAFAVLTVFILVPVLPFIHRFHWPVPTFLFLICIGTLIYNLLAFPFSPSNQLKIFFLQRVDLDSGINTVSLTGLSPFIERIVSDMPSASGASVNCYGGERADRPNLTTCAWSGPAPRVGEAKNLPRLAQLPPAYGDWLRYNATLTNGTLVTKNSANIKLYGRNTRNCRLYFDEEVDVVSVSGAASDKRFAPVGEHGTTEMRLWSRNWKRTFSIDFGWRGEKKGLDGRVSCLWNDEVPGSVPALDEVRAYLPNWATVTKAGDGLVEGYKRFMV